MLVEGIKIIAVTGTNGKTTTAKILCHILKKQGLKVEFISYKKMNYDLEKLFSYFNRLKELNIEIVVMEIDEPVVKQNDLDPIIFDTVLYTNLESFHLSTNEERQSYIDIQKGILNHLSENGIMVINTDDKNSIRLLDNMEKRMIITYGFCSRATITASSIDTDSFVKFNCCIQRGITTKNNIEIDPMEFPVSINLLGKHNVYNTLAAITVSLMYGVLPEVIIHALKEFKGIKRRMYRIYTDGYQIIDDMSHDPSSYEAVFEAIQSVDYENLYIVNAIIGNGGVELNKNNALTLCSWTKAIKPSIIITTSSVDTLSKKNHVLEKEKEVFHQMLNDNGIIYEYKDHLKDAIQKALGYAKNNDLILLLGECGMDKGEKLIRQFIKEKN